MFYPRLELTIPHYRTLTELKKKICFRGFGSGKLFSSLQSVFDS